MISLTKWLPSLMDSFTLYGGGKGSSPPPPDYTGAANATAAGNLDAARAGSAANRVNQYGPYGSVTYNQTPTQSIDPKAYKSAYDAWISGGSQGAAPDPSKYMSYNPDAGWTQTTTLSPEQQAIQDQTSKLNLGLMGTANTGLNYANDVLSKPGIDTSTLAQTGINPGQSYQDAMMARLQPQIDRENQQSDAQLANQGITQGSTAYNNAKTLLNQSHNDLMNNATVQGFNTGLAANQQGFQQQAYNQMQPINVINALRTGSQVQGPQFNNVPQQATTQGPDLLGATNAQYQNQLNSYNAQQAQSGNFMGGLMNLGGAYMMSPTSDIRLKEHIVKIGTRPDGLNVYTYNYKSGHNLPIGRHIGLMAQEVEQIMPDAVYMRPDGYKEVDYGRIA